MDVLLALVLASLLPLSMGQESFLQNLVERIESLELKGQRLESSNAALKLELKQQESYFEFRIQQLEKEIKRQSNALAVKDKNIEKLKDDFLRMTHYASANCKTPESEKVLEKEEMKRDVNVNDEEPVEESSQKVPYLQRRLNPPETSNHAIGFHAVSKIGAQTTHIGLGQAIPFDTVFTDVGGAYHPNHHTFTAPIHGLYIFSSTILSGFDPHPHIQADVVKNGVTLGSVYAYSDLGHQDQSAVTVVSELQVGDEVWVRLHKPPDTSIYGDHFTTFSGALLSPLYS